MSTNKFKTIPLPEKLFYSMIEAQKKLEEFTNEFEDFLFSLDKQFIKKMKKAKKEHLKGKLKDFEKFKEELLK
jgi:hypothetical protein